MNKLDKFKVKTAYIFSEIIKGAISQAKITKFSVAFYSFFAIFSQLNTAFADDGMTGNLMKKAVNWGLFFAAIFIIWYVAKDTKGNMDGSTSIWKTLGKIGAGFIILGFIAIMVNFQEIAKAFQNFSKAATDKSADELNQAVGGK